MVLAGCAGNHPEVDGQPVQRAERDAGTAPFDVGVPAPCRIDALTPPAIVLSSSAGDQTGEQSSFCSNSARAGCGVCADQAMPASPKHFSVVHAADQVTLSMTDGTLVTPGPDTCQPACPPQFRITSHCSSLVIETRTFTEDQAWTVDLNAGVYQISVDASFDADDLTGTTGSAFGLIVDDAREREIVDAGAFGTTCGDGDAGSAP